MVKGMMLLVQCLVLSFASALAAESVVGTPSPTDIEKLVCEVASQEILEKEATQEVCKLIKEHFADVPECEAMVEELWDKIKAMCPKVQKKAVMVGMPTPEEFEKLVCEYASVEIIEKESTEEVCKLIREDFPLMPLCEAMVKELWDKIKAMCPKVQKKAVMVAMPAPEEIEKLVCEYASVEIIEKEATEEVCKLIKEHFGNVLGCEAMVKELWDKIKAMCPKVQKKAEMVAMPTPEEIEKLVCQVASVELIEKEATEEVCKLIKEHFANTPLCEAMVKTLWDKIKARCPKVQKKALMVMVPTPDEIEKLVCEYASDEIIEQEATEEVCKLIKEHFADVPECEAMVKELWDKIKAMCPKVQTKALTVAVPTPEEIEKLVCKVASSEMIEKEATEEVCKLIKEHFADVPECEAIVKELWDQIKAMCPKVQKKALAVAPTPEEIEKLVCQVASIEMIEKEATEEVCKLIKELFADVPECEARVKELWDQIKAMCPKVQRNALTVAVPTPEEIEKLVCEYASDEIIEKEATEEVCKLIKEHFVDVPDCEAMVKELWDKIKAMCPKTQTLLVV